MKIISKFNDFCDCKIAKYGIDEKLRYTRTTSEYPNMQGYGELCFCWAITPVIFLRATHFEYDLRKF
ncbi:MAG: hypothetical protein LUC34_04305 [Campylobacter sp.]|nr:hypothetical protein [Campylobacter sp.]